MREEVHRLVRDWDQYLHLPGESYWKFDGVSDANKFFQHLPAIFPYGSTLFFEGLEIGERATALFREHTAKYTRRVTCDGISPTPDCYHVDFTEKFSDKLCLLIKSEGTASAFYHFKGYSTSEVVFTFHDAFDGELVVSHNLSESTAREFGHALGSNPQLTEFPVDLRQHFTAIDQAMNPPRWKKLLRFFL